jgi:class 3 adenylate cyclase/tetratricopeptide (TPR) repeat protein
VTLLFSDLSGYTALMEESDPEDVDALKRRIAAIAERTVGKHGGTVNQFYGDGLLAVFGLPVPHEQDRRRAIEAALELHEAVRALPNEGHLPAAFEPRMHAGIETGLVLAREGSSCNGRYQLTGDAVNTAARLCAAARRDELLVSHVTLQGVDALFEFEVVPPFSIAGKQKPVVAYRVVGRSSVRTRFEARVRRGLTPFVGRARELDRLKLAMSDAVQGQGQVVGIVGGTGIGKTRLLAEFTRWGSISDANVYSCSCESYGKAAPLQPFIQALRQIFGLRAESPAAAAACLVEQQLAALPGGAAHLSTVQHLLALCPWPDGAARRADDAQRAVVSAFADLFASLVAQRPLVLVVDDWQWVDDASRQVLGGITRALRGRPAMIVLGTRAFEADDPVRTGAEIVELEPFTEAESRQAIRLLVPGVPDLGLGGALHRRSGGNPLFLEELCQALPLHVSGSGEGLADSGVPSTIHELIQARIERLNAREAELLRIASVVGNELPFWLLEHLSGLGPALKGALGRLAEEDLIYRSDLESTFRFKHELTRDGVYQLVRREARRQLHGDVARAIEQRFTGPALVEHYEALSYHTARSNEHARAVRYAELAGDKAMATSALDRARLHYRTALAELDRLDEGADTSRERSARWLAICMRWAATCVFSPAQEQLEVMQKAASYAERLDDANVMAHAEYWLGWIYYALGDQERAVLHHHRALPFAEQAGNAKLRAQLLSNLGQSHAAAGEYDQALGFLRQAIELKRGSPRQRAPTVPVGFSYALGCEALIHADRGAFADAGQCLQEALDAVRHSGHAVEGSLLGALALAQMWQGSWRECIETARLTRATAERVNGPYVFAMSEMVSGYARWMLERAPDALAQLRRAVDWIEGRGMRLFLSCNYAYLAEALADAGEEGAARDYARRALERAAQKDPIGETSSYRTLARLSPRLRGSGDDAADTHLTKAMASAERRGSPREVALTHLLRGELEGASGDRETARASLEAARAAFERMHMPGYALEARRLLARV